MVVRCSVCCQYKAVPPTAVPVKVCFELFPLARYYSVRTYVFAKYLRKCQIGEDQIPDKGCGMFINTALKHLIYDPVGCFVTMGTCVS